MSENENVKILKRGYDLWFESKGEASQYWFDLMADDVEWASVVDERSPGMEFSRDCTGKTEVLKNFELLAQSWEMERCHVDEFIAQGERVVALGTCCWKNKRTGKLVETKKADIFRMREGKILEFCEYYDTAKAISAASD